MSRILRVSPAAARRFCRAALGLDAPHRSVGEALAYHGWIQLDPINVCGRMHDLILRNRVQDYREGDLLRHAHGPDRPALEHFLPGGSVLCVFPLEAWRFVAARTRWRRRREDGPLEPAHERVAKFVERELAERGPLSSAEIEHDARATTGWGSDGRMVKVVLEQMFTRGRVLITGRNAHFHRRYDLPERVLPAELLAEKPASEREMARWNVLGRLRQRRLVLLSAADAALVGRGACRVEIEGTGAAYCLPEDVERLAAAQSDAAEPPAAPLLLAPLDPLIYDRRLTARLWDYAYTWEVYTPPAKRVRGYYALPVLLGDRLVGHVDPKADRAAGRLEVVGRQAPRGVSLTGAVAGLAAFLGLRR
ncbi:MAG: winged helix DNA-binding domain-containing protein [Verrucomicrobia bacterium]|nr:winged helix DNA-binding domain-containing protein [Verrucomicrobiota bacterium]